MITKLLFLTVACALFAALVNTAKAQVNTGDSLALVDFYTVTNRNKRGGWTHDENWLTAAPVNTWYGITVTDNRVTAIRLPLNNLYGYFPESFVQLEMLEYLDLTSNALRTGLPANIGNLIHLISLNVSDMLNFRGEIPPSIEKCSGLQYLNMHRTSTHGSIPVVLSKLKKLIYLDLGECALDGTIPPALRFLVNLHYLDLSSNKLTGTIPASLGNLTKLDTLRLNFNQLSGSIPSSLSNCNGLIFLELNVNQLTGSIPPRLGQLANCEWLSLNGNQLTGTIPAELGNLSKLKSLNLQFNALSGTIPSGFENLTRLQDLSMQYNQLSGEIPLPLLNTKSLISLFADHNRFTCYHNLYTDRKKFWWYLEISDNQYTFNGIEFIAGKYGQNDALYYSPQAPVAIHRLGNKLSVSAGGTLRNNTYQWFRSGAAGSITISGDSTFQPTAGGQYYAVINNKIAKDLTLYTDTVTYTLPVVNNKLSILAYPNPAKHILLLKGLNERGTATITIADTRGNVRMMLMQGKESTIKVNIGTLPTGDYIIIVNDGKAIATVPFVKE